MLPPDVLLRFGYSPNGSIEYDSAAEVLRFSTTASGGGAQLQALSIDASQNVGVGTDSPASLLHVDGAFQATNIDGIIGANTPADGTFAAIVASGIVSVDDTTESTSTTTGSIHTDGGLGVAKDLFIGGGQLDMSAGSADFVIKSNQSTAFELKDSNTSYISIYSNTDVETNTIRLDRTDPTIASAAEAIDSRVLLIQGHTVTLTGSTTVTEMKGMASVIEGANIANASATVTKASNLYVENVAATGTLTNNYAIDTESGAFLTAAGVWTDNPSTITKKQDVLDVSGENMRGLIAQIPAKEWVYRDEWNDGGRQRVGIIAEQMPSFLQPLGSTQMDAVQPSIMAGFALAAVKHLQEEIDDLKGRIN